MSALLTEVMKLRDLVKQRAKVWKWCFSNKRDEVDLTGVDYLIVIKVYEPRK